MTFHENWYSDNQIFWLKRIATLAITTPGAIIEVGCWEGKSTIAIAQTIYPRRMYAIDTWMGSLDESYDHATVQIVKERNVYAQFVDNLERESITNVDIKVTSWQEFFEIWTGPIAFIHIDGAHDYDSVAGNILAILPHLVPHGIICGDDFQTAHAGRLDLDGGVEKAVRDHLPGYHHIDNFWYWRKSI